MNNSPSSQLALDTCVYTSVSIITVVSNFYEVSWRQTDLSWIFLLQVRLLILSQNTFCYQYRVV